MPSTFTINGVTYTGNNITIINGKVIVDGKDVTNEENLLGKIPDKIIEIKVIEGKIYNLRCDANVTCGDVTNDIYAGGAVNCENVNGSVHAQGSVNCDNVTGNVDCKGSVNASKIYGSVKAGGYVNH